MAKTVPRTHQVARIWAISGKAVKPKDVCAPARTPALVFAFARHTHALYVRHLQHVDLEMVVCISALAISDKPQLAITLRVFYYGIKLM